MSLRSLVTAVVLLLFAGCGEPPGGRVLVLGFDGMDPDEVERMIGDGRLPHFARLQREGAAGTIRAPEPLLSPILWTTIATGKDPLHHGIRHFTTVDPDTGEETPVTSRMRRVKALWNLFSEADREVAVVGWWASWPPEPVTGSIVSDRVAYHFLFADGFASGDLEGRVHPPELAERIGPMLRRPDEIGAGDLAPFADVAAERLAAPIELDDELGHLRWALATAQSYADIGLELWRRDEPDLALVYFEATDSVAHLFGHLHGAGELAGELAEQQRRFGGAVEATYRLADEILGRYLDEIGDDTTLVVLSDHGFELGALHADPRHSGDLRRVSEKFHRPEGIFYLYGRNVQPGATVEGARMLDVAPTVLALAGLPPADDMPGRVLTEAVADPSLLPAQRVATYEDGGRSPDAGGDDAEGDASRRAEERAQLERLRSLGYLGGSSPAESEQGSRASGHSDRVLAALLFEEGRLGEAERVYRRLLAAAPEDSALLASLAATLGRQERFAEAEELLNRAIEVNPLQPQAHHNLAVLLERRGATDEAIAAYRRALLVDPGFAPAGRALVQLTGDDRRRPPPESAQQRQALELSSRAAEAAQRGDYERALELLDEAEALAPERPEIFQHRSNVAYLEGDREEAIRALERGLELEPDNPLMAENLRRLRRSGGSDGN